MTPLRRSLIVLVLAGLLLQPAHALNILLTNDDGWDSAGIRAMKEALVHAGHSVHLVASLTGQSGSSAALNLEPLTIVKEAEDAGPEFSVALADGVTGAEPATCTGVGLGIVAQATGSLPDVVVSGINAGQNLGAASQISGTVGAATAAISSAVGGARVPAIAVSTDEVCDEDSVACRSANAAQYARVAGFVAAFIDSLAAIRGDRHLLPPGVGLNINHPTDDVINGAVLARQGQTFSIGGQAIGLAFGCYGDCVGAGVGEPVPGGLTGIVPVTTDEVKRADTTLNAAGYITIVPIYPDFTTVLPDPVRHMGPLRAQLEAALRDIGY